MRIILLLSKLKHDWHTTNSDESWNCTQTKKESIAFIISEYIKCNKLLTANRSKENFKFYYSILEKSAKNIRQKNKEPYIYFESKKNGIKHTKFFLDTEDYQDETGQVDLEYQRCHQLSQKRLMSHFLSSPLNLENIEYFALLVWLTENSCIYAPRNYKRYSDDLIKNNDLELISEEFSTFYQKTNIYNNQKVYSKAYDEEKNKVVISLCTWEKFDLLRNELNFLFEHLVRLSFNEISTKPEEFQEIFNKSNFFMSINEIDIASNRFAFAQNFLDIKAIVLHNI